MSDIQKHIAELEAQLANAQLVANLATDAEQKERSLAHAASLEAQLQAIRLAAPNSSAA